MSDEVLDAFPWPVEEQVEVSHFSVLYTTKTGRQEMLITTGVDEEDVLENIKQHQIHSNDVIKLASLDWGEFVIYETTTK